MKRDPKLHGLSSDHHHALVLARSIKRHIGQWTLADGKKLETHFLNVLAPHFLIEEELLLPALRKSGETTLSDRTLLEHQQLGKLLQVAATGDAKAAKQFAALLYDHIRFEERQLFPACEKLPSSILEEVSKRAPKKKQP